MIIPIQKINTIKKQNEQKTLTNKYSQKVSNKSSDFKSILDTETDKIHFTQRSD